jgi:hypothetical protein
MVRWPAMSDLERLRADILGNPDSDELRAAYGAAIATADPQRAELIRVQLDLTRLMRARAPTLDFVDGFNRERQLLELHKAAWSRPAAEIPGVQWVGLLRGFPEHVRMTARDFLANGEQLYAAAPIRHLDLVDVKPHARELFRSPLLARIRALGLCRMQLGDDEAQLLAASPYVSGLRWLDLDANRIGQAGLEALAASPNLPELRVLKFARNAVADPTPQIGETDTDSGEVMWLAITSEARELESRFGKKAWLSSPIRGITYPPSREQF